MTHIIGQGSVRQSAPVAFIVSVAFGQNADAARATLRRVMGDVAADFRSIEAEEIARKVAFHRAEMIRLQRGPIRAGVADSGLNVFQHVCPKGVPATEMSGLPADLLRLGLQLQDVYALRDAQGKVSLKFVFAPQVPAKYSVDLCRRVDEYLSRAAKFVHVWDNRDTAAETIAINVIPPNGGRDGGVNYRLKIVEGFGFELRSC